MKPQRIDNATAWMMIAVAVIFDIISIIPVVNIIVELVAFLVFGLWFYLKGVSFATPKRLATVFTAGIIGLIPFISILPELTIAVITTILMVKSEDKFGHVVPGKVATPKPSRPRFGHAVYE